MDTIVSITILIMLVFIGIRVILLGSTIDDILERMKALQDKLYKRDDKP